MELINACAPNYVGALTLYLENGIKQEFLDKYNEMFIPTIIGSSKRQ